MATPDIHEALNHLFHTHLPSLPTARAGPIEVVVSATGDGAYAGIVVHNGSDKTIGLADVTATAYGRNGNATAQSEASVLAPYVLKPGAYGIGMVRFSLGLPADSRIDFVVRTDLPDNGFLPIVDLTITAATVSADQVVGTVENTSRLVASPLVAIIGIFFADDGEIGGWFRTYLSDYLGPRKQAGFRSGAVFGRVSDAFAIAASGWAEF